MPSSHLALQCPEISKDFSSAIPKLELNSVNRIPLLENQIRVKVFASSLNFPDVLLLIGKYQMKPTEFPFSIGTEGSGVITEIGSSITKFKVKDEIIFTMVFGSHAEEIIVQESNCITKPKNFSHIEASGLSVGFCTAYHGLVQRGNLKKGETLLVTGAAGGMGVAAIQLGKLIGAKVIAAASSDEKLEFTKSVGADEVINYSTNDLNQEVKKLTGYQGADVIYEVVGGDIFDKCTRCVNGNGRLLVIGFAGGRIPKIPANLPLIKGYSVVGVRAGAAMQLDPRTAIEMYNAIETWGNAGKLPIPLVKTICNVHTEGIEGIRNAIKELIERKAIGKIILNWENKSKL